MWIYWTRISINNNGVIITCFNSVRLITWDLPITADITAWNINQRITSGERDYVFYLHTCMCGLSITTRRHSYWQNKHISPLYYHHTSTAQNISTPVSALAFYTFLKNNSNTSCNADVTCNCCQTSITLTVNQLSKTLCINYAKQSVQV